MIKLSLKFMAVCFAVVSIASAAQAFTITYTLFIDEDGPNTFNLYASTDAPGGISGYGIDIIDATSIDHNSPTAQVSFTTFDPIGFSFQRSADDSLNTQNDYFILASQDLAKLPASGIYGLGVTASDFLSEGHTPGGTVEGDFWGAPVLLASGTHNPPPSFDTGGENVGGNVFAEVGDSDVESASLAFVTMVIPEPSTLILGGFSLIGIFASRRRV